MLFFCGHPHCLLCSSQEFEEEQEKEWKTFVPAPSYAEADELNNLKSLQRKLQETLVLLVKKEKDSPSWEPPLAEVMFDTNETLQQVYEDNLLIQIRIHVIELVLSACRGRHWNTMSYFFLLLRLHPGVYVKLVAQNCMFNF